MHCRRFRARPVSYLVLIALFCLTTVQASAAANDPAGATAPRATSGQAALKWDGRTFTSVKAFKRELVRRGVNWEPFVHNHPAVAKSFRLRPVSWRGSSFYSSEGMARWVKSHGMTYRRWATTHKTSARRLALNSTAKIRVPRPLPPVFTPFNPKPAPPPAPVQTPPATSAPPPTTTAPGTPTTPPAQSAKGAIGIAAGGNIPWYDDAKLAKELDGYATLGVSWIRFDIAWSVAEPQQGVYSWAVYDRLVSKVRERGLNVLAMVGYTPAWARVAGATDDKYPPRNAADYANFAQKVVERYAPRGVKAYEIWNEPNLGCCFWKPKADAQRYTELVRAAYPRMKAVDQSITVMTGGTSPASTTGTDISPPDFLKGMYANGLKGNFDAISHHPYYGPIAPTSFKNWSSWSQMMLDTDRGRSLRGQLVENGDGAKKIWGTEANMVVQSQCIDGFCATEARQGELIKDAVDAWRSYSWAGVLMLYNYYGHNGLSFVRSDWSPTPAWYALRDYK